MSLNGGTQNLCVNLCGPNVLMSEHSGYIFDGDIVRQGECGKAVAGNVEGQILLDAKLCLYQVKVIICLLVGNLGNLNSYFFNTSIAGARIGVKNFVSVLMRFPSMKTKSPSFTVMD